MDLDVGELQLRGDARLALPCFTVCFWILKVVFVLNLQVIELVFKTFPTEAPDVFANYLPKVAQDIIESEVS